MKDRQKLYLGIGISVAAVLLVVFVIGLPGGNASITDTSSPSKSPVGGINRLCVNVKNDRPVTTNYMVEVGIIPTKVAENWFPSRLSFFGKANGGECCPGQENIEDKFIELGPLEEKQVCLTVDAPDSGIEDRCGMAEYWGGKGEKYKSYFLVSNHCHYKNGREHEGFELYDVKLRNMQVGQEDEDGWWIF